MEMGQSYNALSVDHSIEADKDGSTVTLLDVMGKSDDNYDLSEKRLILEKVLPILSEREREIIQFTFMEGLSQKETGERVGLSQMHVSRLQRTAINKLRQAVSKTNDFSDTPVREKDGGINVIMVIAQLNTSSIGEIFMNKQLVRELQSITGKEDKYII